VAIWHGDRPGDPWGAEPDPALLRIGPDEVLRAALGLLAPGRPGRRDVALPVT
jgi:hypothetical protein